MKIVWQVSYSENRNGIKMWEDYPMDIAKLLEWSLTSGLNRTNGKLDQGTYIWRRNTHGWAKGKWVDLHEMQEWGESGQRFEVRRVEILNPPPHAHRPVMRTDPASYTKAPAASKSAPRSGPYVIAHPNIADSNMGNQSQMGEKGGEGRPCGSAAAP